MRDVAAGVTGIAFDDSYPNDTHPNVFEDQTLTVAAPGVLENDGPADPPTKCVVTHDDTGLDGTVDVNTDGSFEFTPASDFRGSTSFTYTMGTAFGGSCPEGGPSNSATVTITLQGVNDPPFVSTDQCAVDIEVAEDSGPFNGAPHCVQMQDFGPIDENNQSFSEWIVSSNKPDLFAVKPAIAQNDGLYGALTFTPAQDANGQATVSVQGRDSGGAANGGDDLSAKVEFKIRITAANDAPTASADSFIVLKDRTLNVGAPGVLHNDHDIDGDSLSAAKVTNPSHGAVTVAADGSFSYAPTSGYEGPDAFSYKASDGSLSSPARIVTLTVTPIPPVATPTPIPTAVVETPLPTDEPIPTESFPLESLESLPTLEPGATPTLPVATLAPGPSATPAPGASADAKGGPPLPLLLVIVLFVLLLAFGAAVYAPKWLAAQRGRPPVE